MPGRTLAPCSGAATRGAGCCRRPVGFSCKCWNLDSGGGSGACSGGLGALVSQMPPCREELASWGPC